MKLLNYQIDALVSQIAKENEGIINAEKSAIRKDKKIVALAKKYDKIISQVPIDVRRKAYIDKGEKQFVDALSKGIKTKTQPIDKTALRRDIILASIECKNFGELKKKIGIK